MAGLFLCLKFAFRCGQDAHAWQPRRRAGHGGGAVAGAGCPLWNPGRSGTPHKGPSGYSSVRRRFTQSPPPTVFCGRSGPVPWKVRARSVEGPSLPPPSSVEGPGRFCGRAEPTPYSPENAKTRAPPGTPTDKCLPGLDSPYGSGTLRDVRSSFPGPAWRLVARKSQGESPPGPPLLPRRGAFYCPLPSPSSPPAGAEERTLRPPRPPCRLPEPTLTSNSL